ncbi:MAG: YidH family protein [Bacteroidales bacterium]
MIEKQKNNFDNSREHLANERTFLAWIRTSIALIGLGFVIVRFSIFLKELNIILNTETKFSSGYSSLVGVSMVILGVLISGIAFFQFKRYESQLNKNMYFSSSILSIFITIIILFGGTILAIYLLSIF